jgi:hypothetical protein
MFFLTVFFQHQFLKRVIKRPKTSATVFSDPKMTESGSRDHQYTWKILDDGLGSIPRIEYYDAGGGDVTPMPLYIPEPGVLATVEKNKMK